MCLLYPPTQAPSAPDWLTKTQNPAPPKINVILRPRAGRRRAFTGRKGSASGAPGMVVTVTPLGGTLSFGAEVRGVDLRAGRHTAEDMQAVVEAWDRHHLLVFKGQQLEPPDEVALAKHFPFDERLDGSELKPWVPPGSEYQQLRKFNGSIPGAPEVELKGIGELGGHLGLSGELFENNPDAEWHTDGTDQPEAAGPPVYTQMYCPEEPPLSGGETMFASAFRAWELLPAEIQNRARELRMRMTEEKLDMYPTGRRATPTETPPRVEYDVHHPLCRCHPRTGQQALCVAPLFTYQIFKPAAAAAAAAAAAGPAAAAAAASGDELATTKKEEEALSPEESHQLIDELLLRGTAPEHVFTARWEQGMVVCWDNRACLHSPTASSKVEGRRLVHRVRMNSGERFSDAAGGLLPHASSGDSANGGGSSGGGGGGDDSRRRPQSARARL
jgi:taurine dioxygenase